MAEGEKEVLDRESSASSLLMVSLPNLQLSYEATTRLGGIKDGCSNLSAEVESAL